MKKELRKNFGIVVMLLDKMQRSVLVEKKVISVQIRLTL